MPRQQIDHGRSVYVVPDDFPERLVRFKEESVSMCCCPAIPSL